LAGAPGGEANEAQAGVVLADRPQAELTRAESVGVASAARSTRPFFRSASQLTRSPAPKGALVIGAHEPVSDRFEHREFIVGQAFAFDHLEVDPPHLIVADEALGDDHADSPVVIGQPQAVPWSGVRSAAIASSTRAAGHWRPCASDSRVVIRPNRVSTPCTLTQSVGLQRRVFRLVAEHLRAPVQREISRAVMWSSRAPRQSRHGRSGGPRHDARCAQGVPMRQSGTMVR
jgi:hypothetical protein